MIDYYHHYKDRLFPSPDRTYSKLPTDHTAIREELARIKSDKLARRMEREKGIQAQEETAAAQSSKGWFKWW
ncbi:hypothetical protein AZE42_08836 [Rhizopogon vesiculosus]|uniref:Uncharacterized protein n=1 Tax=Rhizopogon vesiculosus TaxID=180088 RepID=A0A1J8R3Q1_9AGAM|nr:hypothetical protein AZE42_08836 [Rhizopogon vesiculosus]